MIIHLSFHSPYNGSKVSFFFLVCLAFGFLFYSSPVKGPELLIQLTHLE